MNKKGFKPDGCTLFPDGKHTKCCDLHDWDYTIGINRKFADKSLRDCIINIDKDQQWYKKVFYFVLGWIVYIGVRLFGWFWWYKGKYKRENPDRGGIWVWNLIKDYIKKLIYKIRY